MKAAKTKKGDLTIQLLLILSRAAYAFGELFSAFLLPYGTPMGKALRDMNRRHAEIESKLADLEDRLIERKKFYNLVYRLKKDGLIEKRGNEFKITAEGKRKLQYLQELKTAFPFPEYDAQKASEWYIFIFDIPEDKRREREWIRAALTNMEFKMLQKSVWIGKTKIPEDFLDDMRKLGLLDYIHIFTINRSGSLQEFLSS